MMYRSERESCGRRHGDLSAFVVVLLLYRVSTAWAGEPVDHTETWSTNGIGGWRLDRPEAAVTNEAGYLQISFGSQSDPHPSACVVEYELQPGIAVTNVSFRFLAADRLPSSARLCLHSAETGDTWYAPLKGTVCGKWAEYSVAVVFGPNWKLGPTGSESRFLKAIRTTDRIGLYLRRHGSRGEQRYGVDDFRIQGLRDAEPVSISGVVSYAGVQGGPIRVCVVQSDGAGQSLAATVPKPALYEVTDVPPSGSYSVSAYRDSNRNDKRDFWEAAGVWPGGPVVVSRETVSGVDIALTEPLSGDGMPLWWLHRHFGIATPAEAAQGDRTAGSDPDGDGMSNYGEYRAGTDPNDPMSSFVVTVAATNAGAGQSGIVLKWASASNRTYAVYRAASPLNDFVLVHGGIASTPPRNVYQDGSATNSGAYFYRVVVEE